MSLFNINEGIFESGITAPNLQLTDDSNQLILGSTGQTTVNDESTINRTINIPATLGDCDFVLTDDSGQIIGGDNTFTGINSFSNASGIKVDQISEYTLDHGTTIELINIKDNRLTNGGTYMELDPANFRVRFGIFDSTIDLKTEDGYGVVYFDKLVLDQIDERIVGNGVLIDGVRLRDGQLDTSYGAGILLSDSSGVISSSTTLNIDTINELTSNAGVTVDGILLKDGLIQDSAYGSGILRSDSNGTVTVGANIVDADIASGANIQDTKLATISTAGKVSNSATTATSSNTASAIVARDSSGNFDANVISASLNGSAYYVKNNYVLTSYPLNVMLCDPSSSSARCTTNGSVTYNPLNGRFGSGIIVSQSDQSDRVAITETTGSLSTHYLCFVDSRSGYENINAGNASYTPTGNMITANLTGNVTGNSSTSTLATTANYLKTNSGISGTTYILFTNSTSDSSPVGSDGYLTYNTSTGYLGSTIKVYRSDYTDNADTSYITNSSSSSSTFYLTFVDGTSAYKGLNTGSISYIPLTNTLSCNLNGNATSSNTSTTASSANNINLSAGGSSSNYILFSTSNTGTQSVYTNGSIMFDGTTSTLTCPNFSGTATNATLSTNSVNVGITSNSSSASTHYLALTTNSGGGYDNIKVDSALSYVPSTDTLTCGTVSANLSGTSTNASNIAITDTTSTAGTYLVTFVGASSGNNVLRTDSTNLTYTPSTDTLTCTNIGATTVTANLTGTASNAINATTQSNGTNDTTIATTSFVQNAIPVGCIQMYIATTAPNSNWMVCDGSSLSRSTYSALFAIIGTTYGSADANSFNIPDMRERVPYGYKVTSNPLNTKSGSSSVTLTTNELPSHTHTMSHSLTTSTNYQTQSFTLSSGLRGGSGTQLYQSNGIVSGNITAGNTGSGNSFSIMNPYISVNYIIKVL